MLLGGAQSFLWGVGNVILHLSSDAVICVTVSARVCTLYDSYYITLRTT